MQRERKRGKKIEGTKETYFLRGGRLEERKMCDQVHMNNLLLVSHELKISIRDFTFRISSFSISSLLLNYTRNTNF